MNEESQFTPQLKQEEVKIEENHSSKNLTLSLSVLLVVALLIGGYFIYSQKSQNYAHNEDIRNSEDRAVVNNDNHDVCLNKYKNRKFKYTISTPCDTLILNDSYDDNHGRWATDQDRRIILGTNFISPGGYIGNIVGDDEYRSQGYVVRIFVNENSDNLSLDEWWAEYNRSIKIPPPSLGHFFEKRISISGYPAYFYDENNSSLQRNVTIVTNDFIYHFMLSINLAHKNGVSSDPLADKHDEIFKDILLSFRFLDDSGNQIEPPSPGKIDYPKLPTSDPWLFRY